MTRIPLVNRHRPPGRLRLAGLGLALALVVAACSTGGAKPAASQSAATGSGPGGSGPGGSGTGGSGTGGATTNTGAGSVSCRTGTTAAGGPQGGADVLVPGDIPDGAHYVTYHSPDGYHLDHPEGWAPSQVGGAMVFTDKFNSIRVEVTPVGAAPSPDSARSGEVPALAAGAPCFQAGSVTQVSRRSGPAVLVTYRQNSPRESVTGKVVLEDVERYEFWLGGRQATITLSSPHGSDNVDPWRRVTDSFAWGS